jgi:hypothetical protein
MPIDFVPSIDSKRKRRRGPLPLPVGELRKHGVSVRLNDAELDQLDEQRSGPHMQRGEYLRAASLHRLPPVIPALNRAAYTDLGRLGGLVNQIARRMHEAAHGHDAVTPTVGEVSVVLNDLRRMLLGAHQDMTAEEGE